MPFSTLKPIPMLSIAFRLSYNSFIVTEKYPSLPSVNVAFLILKPLAKHLIEPPPVEIAGLISLSGRPNQLLLTVSFPSVIYSATWLKVSCIIDTLHLLSL